VKYSVFYHQDVKQKDLSSIPENLKQRIRRAIEERLMSDPENYGTPLRKGLHGYRKLRVGDYRVIYSIQKSNAKIKIFKIGHRKEVYVNAHRRVK